MPGLGRFQVSRAAVRRETVPLSHVVASSHILHLDHLHFGRTRSQQGCRDGVALAGMDNDGPAFKKDRLPRGRTSGADAAIRSPVLIRIEPANGSPSVG